MIPELPKHIWFVMALNHEKELVEVIRVIPDGTREAAIEAAKGDCPGMPINAFDMLHADGVRQEMIDWMTANGMSEKDANETVTGIGKGLSKDLSGMMKEKQHHSVQQGWEQS